MQTGRVPCAGFTAEEASSSLRKDVLPPNERCLSEEFHKLCKEHPCFNKCLRLTNHILPRIVEIF